MLVRDQPKLVITYHSDIVRQRRLLQIYRPLLDSTLRRADAIIATSPEYLATSPELQRYRDKCAVVPLGIAADSFARRDARDVAALRARLLGQEPGSVLALFVGRLRYYKGLHILLDALPSLRGVRLVIVGDGPERERLEAQARALGIGERVVFAGDAADADLPLWHQACDLFVLPAHLRAEALGIAQIEAMASGLPCVCTALGTGTTFVNQDGVTGLVVPPGDATALSGAIRRLADDPALRQRYGAAARERARAVFSRERMLDGVEMVYGRALGEQAPPARPGDTR
jgi:rhamnosyl/mannosyltransferase